MRAIARQSRAMTRLAAIVFACLAATPASAEWRLDNGVAIVAPVNNNSTMELLAVLCGDPVAIEVYSRGGPVKPVTGAEEADYFYKPGKVEARVDGRAFPMAAAGSDSAVVLFAEGAAAEGYMAPIGPNFIEALRSGRMLTLAFDVTPEANAADGTPFETVADFPLEGSAEALNTALARCA